MSMFTITYPKNTLSNEYLIMKYYLENHSLVEPASVETTHKHKNVYEIGHYIVETEFDDMNTKIIFSKIYDNDLAQDINITTNNSNDFYDYIRQIAFNYNYEMLRGLYEGI